MFEVLVLVSAQLVAVATSQKTRMDEFDQGTCYHTLLLIEPVFAVEYKVATAIQLQR